MTNLVIALVMFSLLVCLLPVAKADNLANSNSTVLISTSGNTVVAQEDALNTLSVSTTNASTTAVTVTAQSGRDFIEIRAGHGDGLTSNEIWVGVGTTTVVVGTGALVTKDNPLRLPADAALPFSTIASEAVPMCVIQGKY